MDEIRPLHPCGGAGSAGSAVQYCGPRGAGNRFLLCPKGAVGAFQPGYEVVLELGDEDSKRVLLRKKG